MLQGQAMSVVADQPGKRRLRVDLFAACHYLKGLTGRMARGFSQGCVVTGQGRTAVN